MNLVQVLALRVHQALAQVLHHQVQNHLASQKVHRVKVVVQNHQVQAVVLLHQAVIHSQAVPDQVAVILVSLHQMMTTINQMEQYLMYKDGQR